MVTARSHFGSSPLVEARHTALAVADKSSNSLGHMPSTSAMRSLGMVSAAILAAAVEDPDGAVATLRGSVAQAQAMQELNSTLGFPDESTGFDEPGPYLEEPSDDDAEQPQHAKEGWDNVTELHPSAFNTWGRSFCAAHHTGYFCDGTTRVRCCQNTWGYVKCGTTVHWSGCGWRGGGGYPSLRPFNGWWRSSFCTSHHVGFFCYQHHKVHCCQRQGWYVDCSTRSERSWRC